MNKKLERVVLYPDASAMIGVSAVYGEQGWGASDRVLNCDFIALHGKPYFLFPDVLKRWFFQKIALNFENLIFLVLSGKMIFFPENMILAPDGKWKMVFLKKIGRNMIFSSNVLKRCSFQKGSRRDMIFLALSGKVVFFFPKTWYFFPGRKTREGWPFSRNTRKHDIFYLICSVPPCE